MASFNFTRKQTINVGVTVSADNSLEAIVVDKQNRKVLDYKKGPLEYNFQTKEVSDYQAFASILKSMLFDEMGLSAKNISISLTIPNIHMAIAQLSSTMDDAAITTALQAMAQDSYLFKRHEPLIASNSYTGSNSEDTVPVVYSAIQEDAAAQIRNAIVEVLGVENFSINNPNASIINALDYLGIIENQVNSGEIWNFVQITNNGFTLFSMMGTKILEINDMPLPLKTFSPEEIYESMALSLQNNLSIYPAPSLFVLSRTDLLSAQVLLQNMDVQGEVTFLENNKFLQNPLMEVDEGVDSDLVKIISVESIGSAITDKNSPLKLCYVSNMDSDEESFGVVHILGKDIPITDTTVTYALYGVIGTLVVVGGLLYGAFSLTNGHFDSEIAALEQEKKDIDRQIDEAKGKTEGNVESIITDISKNNEATFEYFSAISTKIPTTIWLNHFYTDDSGALGVQGDTTDINALYGFFKEIRTSVENSDISLTKLDYNDIDALLDGNGQNNTTVSFEISNQKYSSVVDMVAAEVAKDKKEGTAQSNGNNTNASGGEEIAPPPLEPLDVPTN